MCVCVCVCVCEPFSRALTGLKKGPITNGIFPQIPKYNCSALDVATGKNFDILW